MALSSSDSQLAEGVVVALQQNVNFVLKFAPSAEAADAQVSRDLRVAATSFLDAEGVIRCHQLYECVAIVRNRDAQV